VHRVCCNYVTLLHTDVCPVRLCRKTITAESGQNVTLTCRASNNNIVRVEWSRADLGKNDVLLYLDGHVHSDDQHPSFKNWVDLQDRQMKDGDASLILKDVMINDAGTYECEAFIRGTNVRKRANLVGEPISIVTLKVIVTLLLFPLSVVSFLPVCS
uniref:Ig-like domain-containing protein n=1 Tax=Maylandia zebra TaxID=106582 RepID=A0A3P9DSS0_9CICH